MFLSSMCVCECKVCFWTRVQRLIRLVVNQINKQVKSCKNNLLKNERIKLSAAIAAVVLNSEQDVNPLPLYTNIFTIKQTGSNNTEIIKINTFRTTDTVMGPTLNVNVVRVTDLFFSFPPLLILRQPPSSTINKLDTFNAPKLDRNTNRSEQS